MNKNNGSPRIRAILVGQNKMFLPALRSLLTHVIGVEVEGETDNIEEAVRFANHSQLDFILCGSQSFAPEARESTIRSLLNLTPSTRVIVLSNIKDPMTIVRAVSFPVSGYIVTAETTPEALASALEAARHGITVFSPHARKAIDEHLMVPASTRPAEEILEGLTPRQREVLSLLMQGLTNKEIAGRLSIGMRTVQMHVAEILERLRLHSRTEAAMMALQGELQSTAHGTPKVSPN